MEPGKRDLFAKNTCKYGESSKTDAYNRGAKNVGMGLFWRVCPSIGMSFPPLTLLTYEGQN